MQYNLYEIIRTLCIKLSQYNINLENINNKNNLNNLLNFKLTFNNLNNFNGNIGKTLIELWNDKNIKLIYNKKNEFTIMDNSEYLLNKIKKIFEIDNNNKHIYKPTFQDSLQTRVKCLYFIFFKIF